MVKRASANVHKVQMKQTDILARISAVRVSNPQTGVTALVYVQHDPGSQVTLISSTLVTELGLVPVGKSFLSLLTLSSSETRHFDRVSFDLEALDSGHCFRTRQALVVSPWSNERYTLPHQQDLSKYSHFASITAQVIPDRDKVDIILGLDNSSLMRVMEELVGEEGEPHTVKTPIVWVASGGKFDENAQDYVAQRISTMQCSADAEKIGELEDTVRLLSLEDEEVQPSINDRRAQLFVDAGSRVVGKRYEMPVPLKEGKVILPNNYALAAKRVRVLETKYAQETAAERYSCPGHAGA